MLLGSPLYTHRHLLSAPPLLNPCTPPEGARNHPSFPGGPDNKENIQFRADTERGRTTKLQAFFQRAPFWLGVERKLSNYSYSGIWQAFFSKVNKISLSLQGKQLTVLLPCRRTTRPVRRNYWAHVPQLLKPKRSRGCSVTREATAVSSTRATTREKPPFATTREKSAQQQRPSTAK